MKTFLLYFFAALLALSAQAALFKGVRPDFIFVLVFFYSLRYGQLKGAAYGAVTGLMIDLAGGFILGPNMTGKAFAGYFTASVRQKLFQWNVLIAAFMIVIFCAIDIFLVYLCFETFTHLSFSNRPLKISIVQVVYTTLAGLILYPVLRPGNE